MAGDTARTKILDIILGDGRKFKVAQSDDQGVKWVKSNVRDVVATLISLYPPGTAVPKEPINLVLPVGAIPAEATNTGVTGQTHVSNPQTAKSTVPGPSGLAGASKMPCPPSTSVAAVGNPRTAKFVEPGPSKSTGASKKSCTPVSPNRHEWSSTQTKRLIALIDNSLEQLKASRNKQSIWREIALQFNCQTITAVKCEDKWKNLKKAYRDFVQKSNCTGTGPSRFEFDEEMGKILGTDPSVRPKLTLDSETSFDVHSAVGPAEFEGGNQYSEEGCQNAGGGGSEKKNRKRKRTTMQELIDFMQDKNEKMLEQLNTMHTENMTVMNKIADKL